MSADEKSTQSAAPAEAPHSLGRIARNSAVSLAASLFSAVFALMSVMVLARALGKDLLGQYYSMFVVVVVIQLLLEAGISTMLTRRIVQTPSDWRRITSEAAGLLLLVAAATIVAMIAIGWLWSAWTHEPRYLEFCIIGSVACAAMQVQRFVEGVFRAFERFEFDALARVLQWGSFALLVFVFVKPGVAGLRVAVVMLAVSHVLAALYLVVALQRRWPCTRLRFGPRLIVDWLSESIPLGLADMFRRLTLQIDHMLLVLLQPPAVLGIYSIAYRPLGPLSLVPRAIVASAFPYFTRAASEDRERFARAFTTSIRLLWILSLPIAATIIVFAEPIVQILAGSEFIEAAAPMRVLIAILVLSYPSTQFRFALTAVGKQRLFTRLVIGGFLFELAVEAALIPRFGYMGACTGFFIGELAFTTVGLWVCYRLGLGRTPWMSLVRALPAAGVMVAGLWFFREGNLLVLLVAATVSVVVFLALSVLFGAIPRDELSMLAGAFRKLAGRAGRSSAAR